MTKKRGFKNLITENSKIGKKVLTDGLDLCGTQLCLHSYLYNCVKQPLKVGYFSKTSEFSVFSPKLAQISESIL